MNIFQQFLSYGLSCIPCNPDKTPRGKWLDRQVTRYTPQECETMAPPIACVCGAISGGLVCVDFDTKNGDDYSPWISLINSQYPELLSKLVIEVTPSGGRHVIFRTKKIVKNLKLAYNLQGAATIETRGEGGYFLCAPSPNYVLDHGDFSKIFTLSDEETEIILSAAASFNLKIQEHQAPKSATIEPHQHSGLSPFDDYNNRCDPVDLLCSHGWRVLYKKGNGVYFQRPKKEGRGISATWGHIPDRFYVFTNGTEFEPAHIYKASAVYAILEHGGDFSAAASALSKQGYGSKPDKPKLESIPEKKEEKKLVLLDKEKLREKIHKISKQGYIKGLNTGWSGLDNYYSLIKGQLNVITGMPSSGKSEFLDHLLINTTYVNKWKHAIFSPENYPEEMHVHKLIEKYAKMPLHEIPKEKVDFFFECVMGYFNFIDATNEDVDLEYIMDQAQMLVDKEKVDTFILDPFNEIELSKPKDISDSDYIGVCLRKIRKFARKNNVWCCIVAHPTKMNKDKEGNYPIPELYDIAGSAHWRNKADNGICVHRDYDAATTDIIIQKIKYRFSGKPGVVTMKYNERGGLYEEYEKKEKSDF